MKRKLTFLISAAVMLLTMMATTGTMWGQTRGTLVSGSGTSGYTIPTGWTSSGTVEGGSYLKFDNGTITSPSFDPHTDLSFTYTVATFGSGTNHPLTVRILNASTDAIITELTTATPTSSSYISTDSPLALGDVDVAFKIQMYAPTGKGIRLRNYSITGTPSSGDLETSDLALTGSPVALNFDLYNNSSAQVINYTTSSTGAVTVSTSDYVTTSVNETAKTITVTPTAVTPSPQTITVSQAADATYSAGSVTFTVTITNTPPAFTVTLGDDSSTLTEASSGAGVTLPTRDALNGYSFAGWSVTNVSTETTTAPTIIPAGEYHPTANITLYPVYSKTVGGGGSQNASASVTISDYATANNWGSSSSANQKSITLNSDVTATCNSGTNSGKYYNDGWRIYQTETGKITITTTSGTLTSVTFTFTVANTGTLNYNSSAITSGTAVNVSGTSAEFTVGNSGSATNGQVRITAISVNYTITGVGTTYYWSSPVAATVEKPAIVIAENPFLFSTTATITCATEGAAIKYSYDSENWSDYSDPLTITETKTIYAKAIKNDNQSSVASVTATKNLAMPTVTIDATGITNTNVFTDTAAGSLSASVTYNEEAIEGAVVTWSGNADAVATIDASTGAVTLVAAGSVTFTATYAGNGDYSEKTATYQMTVTNTDPNAPGSADNPYTVAQARAAIDAGTGLTGVYATGIVSQIVTAYNSQYGNISYNMSADGLTTSDQLQAYRGKSYDGANFTSADDIQVGDIVVVYGTLKKYNSTYEFDQNNQLVSLIRKVKTPTFSPVAGNVQANTNVTISCETQGATIHYTTNGETPTTESTEYSSAISVTEDMTIKALAVKDGMANSDVASATYTVTVTPIAVAPTFSSAAGLIVAGTTVTMSTTTENATIYYTTDGSEPTTSSNSGTTVIINEDCTLKAIAVADGYENSSVSSAAYIVVQHAGTEEDPYNVADARIAIDANMGKTGVYATGIVSQIVTAYGYNNYQNITFNIVDEAGDEEFLQAFRCVGDDAPNVLVNDNVVVYGDLTKHNSTYEFGQGCQVVSLEHPIVPAITASDVNLTYNATSGSIAYEITNPVDGGALTAAITDGNEGTWLTLGAVGESAVALTCSANEGDEDRTATVTLTYTYNTNETVTKAVTVTQAHFVVDYATLPFAFDGGSSAISSTTGLTQSGLGSDYGSSPKLKFDGTGDWVILKINERPGLLTFDIKGNSFSGSTFKVQTSEDGETYTDLETYTELGNKQSEEFSSLGENVRYIKWVYTEKANGNVALGNITLATYQEQVATPTFSPAAGDYNEAQNVTIACATNGATIHYTTNGDTPTAESTEYTAAIPVTTTTTIKAIAVKEGMANSAVATATYTITAPVPAITASDVNLTYNATSGSIAYEITNPVDGGALTAAITDGNEGSWLALGAVGESAVALTCSANEGDEDRTATVTLTYTYNTNETVTKAVTVTQAHFVVDYATLPFEFDGGSSAISSTNGLTQNGLGTDYGSSPKLKFDTTNDWVILKINERPGVLTFDIKGNSFSGSTFKVQTSEDGETYTDLETYTTLGNTQSESFDNLGSDVRYIKWIYTEKSSGNVALGNIELAAYQEQQEQVATPTFTPEAGEYNAAQNVTIACTTNGATIHYTTNGDTPTAESTEYTAAIPVSTTTTIKAIAVKDGMNNSAVATATYTINATPTPSQNNWVLADLADLTASDVFVIVGNNGNTYAMANNNGTSAPAAVAITVENNELSGDIAENIQWNISGNANDGYIFYPNGSTTTWLYCINNNNGLKVGTGTDKTFEIKDNYLYNKGQERYIGIYSSQDWRSYTNTTGNIAGQTFAFYKKVSTEPSITINPGPYNMNCDGGHAVLEVSCSNMAQNPQLEVVFYESDGTTAAAYNHDWITATINNDGNLDGTIQLNNSNEARSAYFKIKGVGNDNSEVYSDLVTINQAAYSLSIVFETDELNIEVGGESDRKISFDYSGLGSTPTFEVRRYASDGTTSATYDWLTTSINKNKVNITVSANTGAARHAYFKVYGAGNNTNTESNLVTINQAEYVALTYTVTYDANGGTGTMTDPNSPYTENAEVTLLENTFTAPEGKIWDSWSVKDANQETITVNNGKFNMPASNVTVSAQWVDNPVTPTYEWELTELADLTTSDVFVIVGNNGNTYAMSNDNGTNNPPTASAVTIANNKLSAAPADNLKWNISGNATDGYTFYPNGTTETWLYCTNTNNGVRVGTNNNKFFTVDDGYLMNTATSRYVGIYNSSDWRCYTSTDGNIANQTFAFYKKVSTEPSITATSGSNLAYDATSGSIFYEIENYEDGTMTAETTANWISNIAVEEADEMGEVTFNVTPNTSNVSRSATVTLTFTYDTDKTATADVTVTQNGQPGQPSITVDPESAVVVSDGGAPEFTITYASITIANANDFDVQFYESNGTTTISKPDWIISATISGNTNDGFTLTVTVDANTSAERAAYLKVYALDGDDIIYSNLITISQNEYIPPATYTLVTDIDQVVSGKHYIIASSAENGTAYAMGAQNTNNRAGVAVTVSDANITQTGGVYEFVINGPNDGKYTIYDKINSGYLYAASSGSNYLKTETELDNNGRWSINVANTGVATIIANGTNTRNNMRYNSNSKLFSCYNSGQSDVYIYVKDDDTELEYYGDPVSLEASAFDFTHNTYSVGGTMTITGGPVANDPSSLIIQDGAQLIHESPINATVQNGVTAAPSWTSNVGGGWYFIASPVDDAVIAESILVEPFDLYKYDEPEAMWYAYNGDGDPFTTMERGIGYLHASADDQILAFAGTMIGTETEITKPLSYACTYGDLIGYNLMGNPYTRVLEYGDMKIGGVNVTSFLSLNDAGTEYVTCNLQDNARIRPCQGFFIQATGAGQNLVFNPAKKDKSEIGLISIKAGNEEFMDKAYIQIGGGNTLRKIAFSDNNMVYVMDGDDDYAAMTIYELANPIPVHFMAAEPGTYTITVNSKNIDLDYMHLVDEFTNEHIDLLSEPTYTFTSAEGDKPGRFTIVFGIDNVEENFESNVFAYQNEDELVVDGKGTLQIFDVLGRFVGSHEVNGSERISLSSLNTGVYVLRMVGENVKTQKIVVR